MKANPVCNPDAVRLRDIDFGTRVNNALLYLYARYKVDDDVFSANVETVEQLLGCTANQIIRTPGIGAGGFRAIISKLGELGFISDFDDVEADAPELATASSWGMFEVKKSPSQTLSYLKDAWDADAARISTVHLVAARDRVVSTL